MRLTEVLAGVGAEPVSGSKAVDVLGLSHDSRRVKPGDLFVAMPGTQVDGAQFVADAVKAGAVAVLAERKVAADVPCFVAGSARKALALAAANFYRKPAADMMMLAVTGTNGKTTTAYLL